MKVLIVNPLSGGEHARSIIEERDIPSLTVIDGMYVKELGMMQLAYVYKAEKREEIQQHLDYLKRLDRDYNSECARILYTALPKLRADEP